MNGELPNTVQAGLFDLAEWLDTADALINKLAKARGIERRNDGDAIQRALRHLAVWFDANPQAADEAWAYVRSAES